MGPTAATHTPLATRFTSPTPEDFGLPCLLLGRSFVNGTMRKEPANSLLCRGRLLIVEGCDRPASLQPSGDSPYSAYTTGSALGTPTALRCQLRPYPRLHADALRSSTGERCFSQYSPLPIRSPHPGRPQKRWGLEGIRPLGRPSGNNRPAGRSREVLSSGMPSRVSSRRDKPNETNSLAITNSSVRTRPKSAPARNDPPSTRTPEQSTLAWLRSRRRHRTPRGDG